MMKPALLGKITAENLIKELKASPARTLAAKRLAAMGMPDKKSEEYRYADIGDLMNREWETAESAPAGDIAKSSHIIITDGTVTAMPKSAEFIAGCSDTVDIDVDHFDPLYYLGHLMSRNIISIRFKKDAKVTIEHRFTHADRLLAYRVAIYVDSGVHVQIDEHYEGSAAQGALILTGYDAFVSRDAGLNMISDRTLSPESYTPIFSNRIKADSYSNVFLQTFDFGDGKGLQLIKAELHECSSIQSDHLLYIGGRARMGTVSKFIHIGKNSSSRQKAKNILKDRSRGIFDALIKVEYSGKYTKAHQNSRSILLNDGAHMVSKPQLEIYIDDLEASHGSTTGQLDGRQLFYLRSRGISEEEAKKILILGFANELIDEIRDENIRENIHKSFERAYYGQTHVACMETCHGCENTISANRD